MRVFIRLNGQQVTSVVSALAKPEGYVEVDPIGVPADLAAQLGFYDFMDGRFVLRERSPDERAAELSMFARQRRGRMLTASDWTQVPDAPVDRAAWAAYRQALRDLPQQPGFPEVIDWPEPPA